MSNKKTRTLLIFNYPHAASTSELRLQLEPLGCCVGEIERVSLSNQQQANQSGDSMVRVSVQDDQAVEQLIRRELVVAVRGIQLFFFADDILQGEKVLQSSVLGFLNEKIPAFDVKSLAPPGVVCSTYPWEFGGGNGGGYIFKGPTAQLQIVEERLLQYLNQATAPKHPGGGASAANRPSQVVSPPVRPLMSSTSVCAMASPPMAPVMSPSARPVMPTPTQMTPDQKLLKGLREANKRAEEFGGSRKHPSGLSQAPFGGRQQSFGIIHHTARSVVGTGAAFTDSLPFKPYAADSFIWDDTAAGDQDAGFSRQLVSSASSKVATISSRTPQCYFGMRFASRKNSGGETANAIDEGSTSAVVASEQNSCRSVAGSEVVQDATSGSQGVFGALELKLLDVPAAVEQENVGLALQSKGNQRTRKVNPTNRSLAQHQIENINQWMAKVPHGLSGNNQSELPEDNGTSFAVAATAAGIASRQPEDNANVSGPSAVREDTATGDGACQSVLAGDGSEPVPEEEGLQPDYEFEGGDADDFKEASSDWQDLVGKDFCQVCKCKLSGSMNEQTAQAHCKGAKHKKKFRRQQSDDSNEA